MKTTLSILTIAIFFLITLFHTKLIPLSEPYYLWLVMIGPLILYPTFYAGFCLLRQNNNIKTDIVFITVSLVYLISETGTNIVLLWQAIALLTGYMILRIVSDYNKNWVS